MKVLGVSLFIFLLSILIIVIFDISLGLELSQALSHLFNPFWVIETGEYVMLALFFFIVIVQQLIYIYKDKADK